MSGGGKRQFSAPAAAALSKPARAAVRVSFRGKIGDRRNVVDGVAADVTDCAKTPRQPATLKKRPPQFRYGAFSLAARGPRTLFSFFQNAISEFSHSLCRRRLPEGLRKKSNSTRCCLLPGHLNQGRLLVHSRIADGGTGFGHAFPKILPVLAAGGED